MSLQHAAAVCSGTLKGCLHEVGGSLGDGECQTFHATHTGMPPVEASVRHLTEVTQLTSNLVLFRGDGNAVHCGPDLVSNHR